MLENEIVFYGRHRVAKIDRLNKKSDRYKIIATFFFSVGPLLLDLGLYCLNNKNLVMETWV